MLLIFNVAFVDFHLLVKILILKISCVLLWNGDVNYQVWCYWLSYDVAKKKNHEKRKQRFWIRELFYLFALCFISSFYDNKLNWNSLFIFIYYRAIWRFFVSKLLFGISNSSNVFIFRRILIWIVCNSFHLKKLLFRVVSSFF